MVATCRNMGSRAWLNPNSTALASKPYTQPDWQPTSAKGVAPDLRSTQPPSRLPAINHRPGSKTHDVLSVAIRILNHGF